MAVAGTGTAHAGGFGVRQQSSQFQGTAYAGSAAGGGLSSMFWNPAAAGQFNGIWTESHYAYSMSSSTLSAGAGTTPGLLVLDNSTDVDNDLFVSSSYVSYQLSQHLIFALSVTSPFGLASKPDERDWAGREFGRTSKIESYNFSPTLAWRVSPGLIVGAGLQIQRLEATIKTAVAGIAGAPNSITQGDDTALGFTLGALWQPHEGTTIGLGWRSSIRHDLEGTSYISGNEAFGVPSVRMALETPDIVTLSVRHVLNPRLAALGTVEWTRWSTIGNINAVCTSVSGVICPATGGSASSLGLDWGDGWLMSGGVEYLYQPGLMLRAGLAYEISPAQSASERTIRIPDTDTIWASIGATYKWSESISLDFAYSHGFGSEERFDRLEGGQRLVGTMDTSSDIVSVSFKTKFGGSPAVEPMK
jgi:long-chain fatty acid transport protein